MELHITPALHEQLTQWSATTGQSVGDIVEEAIRKYFQERERIRETLDSRYDDIKSGRVQLIDGESFFKRNIR